MQPEDDGLSVYEAMQTPVKYIVVCRDERKSFPLIYLEVTATCEQDAKNQANNFDSKIKVVRAYLKKS